MYKDATYMHSLAIKDHFEGTIDATIGVFLDEQKSLVYSNTFHNSLLNLENKYYNYAAVDGGDDFKDAIRVCFNVPSEYTIIATPGGTGALTILLRHMKKSRNALVFPKLSWGNYNKMAQLNDYDIIYCETDTLEFDYSVVDEYDNIILVINTPASNPIGISYSKKLLDAVMEKVKTYNNIEVVFDLAYFSYEDNQEFLFEYGKKYGCYYMLSLSKTLGVYGFRLGALVSSKQESLTTYARGTWSSISNIGIMAFVDAVKNIDNIREEIITNRLMLQERTKYFLELLDEYNIPHYTCNNGFFVTLKYDNPTELVEYLMEHHIYTLVCNGGVRIAVCSLNKHELLQIIKIIKKFRSNHLH